jgi:hypothetical protein
MAGNTIDIIMDTPPKDLKPGDLEELVAYHRAQRGNLEAGVKPKKDRGPAPSIAPILQNLIAAKPKPVGQIKRRI